MRDFHLGLADRALADGDYVQAVEHLEKAIPLHPELAKLIQEALERMRKIGTREMAAGRWTIAEGILDVVKEHEERLTASERTEVDLLMEEIRRLRDVEQNHALLRTAMFLAAHGRHTEARQIATSVIQGCEDVHMAARLRCLLQGLPHPDGRLLFGFDSPLEIRQFCKAEGGASIESYTDLFSPREGCAARIYLPGAGAQITFLDVPSQWEDYAEINFWLSPTTRPHSEYLLLAGNGRSWFHYRGDSGSKKWAQVRLPLDRFARDTGAEWGNITRLVLTTRGSKPVEILLDEVRLKPK
jgi:hypothetical protein